MLLFALVTSFYASRTGSQPVVTTHLSASDKSPHWACSVELDHSIGAGQPPVRTGRASRANPALSFFGSLPRGRLLVALAGEQQRAQPASDQDQVLSVHTGILSDRRHSEGRKMSHQLRQEHPSVNGLSSRLPLTPVRAPYAREPPVAVLGALSAQPDFSFPSRCDPLNPPVVLGHI